MRSALERAATRSRVECVRNRGPSPYCCAAFPSRREDPLSDPLQLVGTTIAEKYAVESVVGEGGFAIVYKATHLIWKRPVAIKAFKSMGSFAREGSRAAPRRVRPRRGAPRRAVRALGGDLPGARRRDDHDAERRVGAVHGARVARGGDARARARRRARARDRRRAPCSRRSQLLEPVGEALALAHARGIAHRDVKPGNIFLLGDPRSESCTVKLLDFGIAKVVQDAQKMAGAFSQTSGQVTSFTPAYGAPEQFSRAQGATGPWTDVFALALIFERARLRQRAARRGRRRAARVRVDGPVAPADAADARRAR